MPTEDDPIETQRKVALLDTLVRQFAWCRIQPMFSFLDDPEYLLVIESPGGRQYWRVSCTASKMLDEMMMTWAEFPTAK